MIEIYCRYNKKTVPGHVSGIEQTVVSTIVDEPQQCPSGAATLHRAETLITSYERKKISAGLKYANYVKDVYVVNRELERRHLKRRSCH